MIIICLLLLMIIVMRIINMLNLLLLRLFMWGVLILLCMWLIIGKLYVIFILLILFMILLKVTMREGNMVWWISMILSFPFLCCNSWSCTYFSFLCFLLCAFMTCLFTRLFFRGSGFDLNVFHIWFLMLSIALSSYMVPLPQALIWRPHEHLCKLLRLAQMR
jgi:hypothetical protein